MRAAPTTAPPCRSIDPEVFFPPSYGPAFIRQVLTAKALCQQCTVSPACLTEALDREEQFGIWGGTTPQERLAILARLNRQGRHGPLHGATRRPA